MYTTTERLHAERLQVGIRQHSHSQPMSFSLLGGPKFHPAADPLSGGAGRPKFNQLEIDGHYLYLQTQFGED